MKRPLGRVLFTVMTACACLLAAPAAALAGQIALAWDPNPETDIAGYIIEWGTASAPFSNALDVGNVTTCTLANLTDGVTYTMRLSAYNKAGVRSDPSASVSGTPSASTGELILGRTTLNFGVVRNGATILKQTSPQTVTVSAAVTGTLTWNATPSNAWVQISPSSGTGNGAFTVSVNAAAAPSSGNADATITVNSAQVTNGPLVIAVHLTQLAGGTSMPPVGSFDTPANNATGVVGAIAVTGWALDDVEVTAVELWRDPVGSEPVAANGKVFIGNAVFVPGARPDVETLAPTTPFNYRAGWGYLLLTNALPTASTPTGGTGTYTLYAYADDAEGFQTPLGSKRITATNSTATLPFGTIDTPAQGQTISGSAYASFGWALSPKSTIPVDGSTIDVYVDGVNLGHPTYNQFRSDIATAFSGYANSSGAVGFLILNTTTLTNGVHTIGWIARDAAGNAQGLGSRFFSVFNSGGSSVVQAPQSAASVSDLPIANEPIEVRRAFTPDEPSALAMPENTGRVSLQVSELDMIELRLQTRFGFNDHASYTGYQLIGSELRHLPAGSTFDANHGIFKWQPGAGFVGGYDFVFVRTAEDGTAIKIPVHVEIVPKSSHDR